MSSANNSSNLLGNVNISNISNQGARLIMQHPLTGFSGGALAQISGPPRTGLLDDDGFTAGDVVRYDTLELLAGGASNPSYQKYVKAKANVAEHSEVIGVIESFSGGATGNEQVNIVLHGQIEYPSAKLANMPYDPATTIAGASGGNDIYFLSEVTAGVLQNLAPSTVGTIAKPVLQAAADGTYTGHVINYIGYQIGGSVNVHGANTDQSGTVQNLVDFADRGRNLDWDTSTHWFPLNVTRWLPAASQAPEFGLNLYNNVCDSTFYGGMYGVRYLVALTTQLPTDTVGKTFEQKNTNGSTMSTWKVIALDRANSTVTLEGLNINDRTNKIIPTDTSKKLWQGRTAYTIDTSTVKSAVLPGGGSERISFALPYDTSSSQSYSFRDINGGTKTYGTVNLMYAHPDEGTSSASFAEHITLDTVEVSKSLTITSADGTTKTTDVAKVLSQLETDIVNIGTKMGVSLTSKEIT